MDSFGTQFGILMGQLVGEYRTEFSFIAPIFHIGTLVVLYLAFWFKKKYRRVFSGYFLINYVWIFIFVGIWFCIQLFNRMGMKPLLFYCGTPLLLLVILFQLGKEFIKPQLDLQFTSIKKWRLLVSIPIFIWGFWYPKYEWGAKLTFEPIELLFGAYGLMGCPTAMVLLSILFLTYPSGNRELFHAMTAFSLVIGAAMVSLFFIPDIPLLLIGIASFGLIISIKFKERSRKNEILETSKEYN